MKIKFIFVLLLTAAILALTGCGKALSDTEKQQNLFTPATGYTAEKEESGEIPTEDVPDTTAVPTEPAPQTVPQTPTESEPVASEPPKTEPPQTESDKPVTEAPKQEEPKPSNPEPTEPATEPPKQTEPPVTTEPPKQTEPPATEQPTEPPAVEEPTVPAFDIEYWVSYAKSYAQSVGLRLENSAVDCWDNPITAGAHSQNLERDIQGRLNRYAKDEDITDVWIWVESIGNGEYNIYIGYA